MLLNITFKEIIDEAILEVRDNVEKGEKEILEAKVETVGTSRKIYWLIFIVVLVIIAVILIVYFALLK